VLTPYKLGIAVFFLCVISIMNLKGVQESGRAFAIPTYGFVASVFLMVGAGLSRTAFGHAPMAESASLTVHGTHGTAGAAVLLLALRAFAQGCTALTGVEAVSNGVPNFRRPKSKNAATTLTIMGLLAVTMFAGITALAAVAHVHIADSPAQLGGAPRGYEQKTVIAQLGGAVFGHGSILFFLVQAFTAAILVLAANTAFNGFPILASILGGDGYLPRQFARRGDRLVFSNGIVILSLLAGGLIWAFDASTTRLIQLYIIGVFVSFTLSQTGMVKHWGDELRRVPDPVRRRAIHRSRAINLVGAILTGLVLVIVLLTKFVHGAWIVVVTMPLVFLMMKAIHRHYRRVAAELEPSEEGVPLPSRIHGVVLVSKLHTPTLRALAFARATRPSTLTALSVATSEEEAARLQREWAERDIPVPLKILDSPYRDITGPVLDYVGRIRMKSPRDVVCVFIPEYVVGRWWEHLLHNQSAFRLKARLLFRPGVMVTSVPWQLGSAEAALARGTEDAGFAARRQVRSGAA
jgi:amino acid transporter